MHGGPRRLSKSTASRPRVAAERERRNAAADDSLRARSGRNRKARVLLPAAATCRRLTWMGSIWVIQHSSAPNAPLARACSAAHSASRGRPGETTAKCAKSIPRAAQAVPLSGCGGATSSDQRPSARMRPSTGSSSEHSPSPALSARISVSAPRGQPPPGSSASSWAKPLASTGMAALAKRSAHQTSGRARISARATVAFIVADQQLAA